MAANTEDRMKRWKKERGCRKEAGEKVDDWGGEGSRSVDSWSVDGWMDGNRELLTYSYEVPKSGVLYRIPNLWYLGQSPQRRKSNTERSRIGSIPCLHRACHSPGHNIFPADGRLLVSLGSRRPGVPYRGAGCRGCVSPFLAAIVTSSAGACHCRATATSETHNCSTAVNPNSHHGLHCTDTFQ